MEVTVDRDRCESNAVCCGLAPEVFELDESEELLIKVPNPGPELEQKVEKAVERCPRNALELHP